MFYYYYTFGDIELPLFATMLSLKWFVRTKEPYALGFIYI